MKNKVIEYSESLKKLGIENEILEHPHLVKPIEVVTYLGKTLSDSAATLLMIADGQPVALIRRDDVKISFPKVKKLLGIKDLRIATPEEFTTITSLPIGAARHYLPGVKQTIIDNKVFEKEFVMGGTGSFEYTVRLKSDNLKKLPNSFIEDIVEDSLFDPQKFSGNKINRVFSGIRATGRLHLGNYLGAVKGFLELQKTGKYETVYCVVDVHTITTPFQPEGLRKNKREIIIDYLAAGLDPEKSMLIYQSDVPEHTELAFYFSSVMTVARMMHLPTYKEKIKQYPNNITMALLNYPILMAADILVYKAGLVPVGIDQEPHLEVTREIARKMNQLYGTDFPEPIRFATKGEYVPSLSGTGKMSKTTEGSYINLTDSKEDIKKKIRSIPTATLSGGEMNAGFKSLFAFADLFIPEKVEGFKKQFANGSLKFVEIKDAISEAIYNELKPFQEKRQEIEKDQNYVDRVIKQSAEKARTIASKTVKEVKEKMGLI